jgi:hypothetical protein
MLGDRNAFLQAEFWDHFLALLMIAYESTRVLMAASVRLNHLCQSTSRSTFAGVSDYDQLITLPLDPVNGNQGGHGAFAKSFVRGDLDRFSS